MLGVLTPEQKEAKQKVEKYFKVSKTEETTLEAFVEPKEISLENLLRAFPDPARLKRAQRIKNNELTIQEQTEEHVRAKIRDYHIIIDLKNKTILHDCADWSRVLPSKKICKHLGKLFLTLENGKARKILQQIYSQKQKWRFKPYAP